MKGQNFSKNFKLISFHVTLLTTNVPLDFLINVFLKRIYDQNELQTNILNEQMRELLLTCITNVNFSHNSVIFTQISSVRMG